MLIYHSISKILTKLKQLRIMRGKNSLLHLSIMLIIREWDSRRGTTCFSIAITTLVHYRIYLENWTAPSQPSTQNIQNIEVSEQVTIQTFQNTRAILQYIYFTIIKSNLNIFTFPEMDFKNSLPILPRLCLERTGKYDTNGAVLISHSSSCEKDWDHETLWCLYPAGYIVKSFSGFHKTETYKIRRATRSHYALETKQQPRSQYFSKAVYINTEEIKQKSGRFRTLHK